MRWQREMHFESSSPSTGRSFYSPRIHLATFAGNYLQMPVEKFRCGLSGVADRAKWPDAIEEFSLQLSNSSLSLLSPCTSTTK